jgi:hypothetical protein
LRDTERCSDTGHILLLKVVHDNHGPGIERQPANGLPKAPYLLKVANPILQTTCCFSFACLVERFGA